MCEMKYDNILHFAADTESALVNDCFDIIILTVKMGRGLNRDLRPCGLAICDE